MEADFSGWATKNGIKCSDGRIIGQDAFKHQDKFNLPLVWRHNHTNLDNVLGHVMLENRADGVYSYGFFNDTEAGQKAKELVLNKDVDSLSIFAKNLVHEGSLVKHGDITEVSLVMAGANIGAKIDNVSLAHGDGSYEIVEDEAIIYSGEFLQHENPEGDIVGNQNTAVADDEELQHAASTATATATKDDETVGDILNTLTPKQQEAVEYVVGAAVAAAQDPDGDGDNDAAAGVAADKASKASSMAHSADIDLTDEAFLAHVDNKIQEGFNTMRNAFEQNGDGKTLAHEARPKLTKDQLQAIINDESKGSLYQSFLSHAEEYGITDIDLLFPDATYDGNGIAYISRRMEWVQNVLDGTKHSPFSRIKSFVADITADQARAKGYAKGNLKKDEIIKMLRRVTTPTTVYKKQKLDRDDIIDIVDIDILVWIQGEMRLLLDEEIARAILVGDNRESDDDDKIDEDSVRPIAYDIDMYNTTVQLDSTLSVDEMIDAIVEGLNNFKGSGTPTLYTTRAVRTKMLLAKDAVGRRLYPTMVELSAALTVADVIDVEAMEDHSDLIAIAVNLIDYTVGADKGGEINLFDFFDIDYNQQKYLLETRISGSLTRPKSAVTFVVDAANVVTPQAPAFNNGTGVVTIPAQTGVVYTNSDTGAILASGAQAAINVGSSFDIKAIPAEDYGFTQNVARDWTFTRTA